MTGELAALVLHRFDEADVPYCIWKGSNHLAQGLVGQGDLDVLVPEHRLEAARHVLRETGFLRADHTDPEDQPGLEDYFGADGEALVQLQLYSEPIVGDMLGGWWRVPRADEILASRCRAEQGPFCAAPTHQAVLLLVRVALSARHRDVLARPLWRRTHTRWAADWRQLLQETTLDEVRSLSAKWYGPELADCVTVCGEDLNRGGLLLARSVIHQKAEAVRDGRGAAARWTRHAVLIAGRLNRRLLGLPWFSKRRFPGGGVITLFTGPFAEAAADQTFALLNAKFDSFRVKIPAGSSRTRRVAALRRVHAANRARRRGLLVICSAQGPVAIEPDSWTVTELPEAGDSMRSALTALWRQVPTPKFLN